MWDVNAMGLRLDKVLPTLAFFGMGTKQAVFHMVGILALDDNSTVHALLV